LRRDDPTGTAYGPAVSLGVTLPIWDGGGPALRGAEAQRSALESELIIKRRNAEAEQQAAAIRAAAAREAAVAGARVREDAGRLGGIAEIAYQAGEIGVVELLDAYEAARDTNLSVIALALNAAESAVEYDVTTGRNYE
jgi:cobalt-zinc-cadmium efflux system outer membrane protein